MRLACASGGFYPGREDELKQLIQKCFDHELGPTGASIPIIGGVTPHAGYIYSGASAAWIYHHLRANKPQTIVYLGPNHTGYGSMISVSSDNCWMTPLGEVKIDLDLRKKIVDSDDAFVLDDMAHKFEHSIEVQLPFLQSIWKNPKIVPICIATADAKLLEKLGGTLSKLDCLVLASSDMSHFLTQEKSREKDMMAIEKILDLDPTGLLRVVEENDISMCGVSGVAAMLWALKNKAKKGQLLSYYTSGDITGDKSRVVGYASIAIR